MVSSSVDYYKRLAKYYGGSGFDDDNDDPEQGSGSSGITTTNCFTRWVGGACESLGLPLGGQVTDIDFERLCAGVHPVTDKGLVQNANKDSRCPGWDFTFSLPKSESMKWAAADRELKDPILADHDDAVEYTLKWLEDKLAFSRVGKSGSGNQHLQHVRLAVANWRDYLNREGEPQLHTHATVINLGLREDGKYNTLHSSVFYPWKKVLGAVYRAKYTANQVQRGAAFERDKSSFRAVGVPQLLCENNSTRRKQILADCKSKGFYNAVEAHQSSLATRRTKPLDVPALPILDQQFRDECEEFGFTAADVERLYSSETPPRKPSLKKVVAEAIEELCITRPHFNYQEMLFASLVAAAPHGFEPDVVDQELRDTIDLSLEIIPLNGESYTTKAQLDREVEFLRTVDTLKHRRGAKVSPAILRKILGKNPKTTDEQKQAIQELCSGTSGIRTLEGIGGSGKTSYVLSQAVEAFRKSGYQVCGLAPTGVAASQLNEDTPELKATTIASRFGHWKLEPFEELKHIGKELVKDALRVTPFLPSLPPSKLRKPKAVKLNSKTVIIVDEASMVGFGDSQQIAAAVEKKYGAMVIFCGDRAQLPAIGSVAPFSYLCRFEPALRSVLVETRRQKQGWQREMVKAAQTGDPRALKLLQDNGCVVIKKNNEQRIDALIEDWTQFGITQPERSTIVATTNEDAEYINKRCQDLRIKQGALDSSKGLIVRDESGPKSYLSRVHVGDKVLLTKNRGKIRNGHVGTVIKMRRDKTGNRVLVVRIGKKGSQKLVTINPAQYKHIRLGYVATDFRSQGATYENVYFAPGQQAEGIFVALSRGCERIKLFVTRQEVDPEQDIQESNLALALARKADLRLATELLPEGLEVVKRGFKVIPPPEPMPTETYNSEHVRITVPGQVEHTKPVPSPWNAPKPSSPTQKTLRTESEPKPVPLNSEKTPVLLDLDKLRAGPVPQPGTDTSIQRGARHKKAARKNSKVDGLKKRANPKTPVQVSVTQDSKEKAESLERNECLREQSWLAAKSAAADARNKIREKETFEFTLHSLKWVFEVFFSLSEWVLDYLDDLFTPDEPPKRQSPLFTFGDQDRDREYWDDFYRFPTYPQTYEDLNAITLSADFNPPTRTSAFEPTKICSLGTPSSSPMSPPPSFACFNTPIAYNNNGVPGMSSYIQPSPSPPPMCQPPPTQPPQTQQISVTRQHTTTSVSYWSY